MTYSPGTILLDKYRIEDLVGEGSFGQVYHATNLRLSRPHALKILRRDRAGLGSEDYRMAEERFQFEARLGAKLEHPFVIRVYELERLDEQLCLVMEYAPGGSLKDKLKSGKRLTIQGLARLGMDLCQGLEAIHRLGAVHRDLKPANILFAANGSAKIADLGLAQITDDTSRRSLLGSLAGAHPGTPLYMSPEQENTKGYLQPSSDIFSLGCILFEALTGQPYKRHYGERARDLRERVPAWLDEILARMLAEQPARVREDDADDSRRFRLATQVRTALETGWRQEKASQEINRQKVARDQELAGQLQVELDQLRAQLQEQEIALAGMSELNETLQQMREKKEAAESSLARQQEQIEALLHQLADLTSTLEKEKSTRLELEQKLANLERQMADAAQKTQTDEKLTPQEDALAWLESLAQLAHESPSQPEPAEGTAPATSVSTGLSSAEQEDALAWLESLAQKQGAKPEELITAVDARSETAPSWVTAASPQAEPAAAAPEEPALSALVTGPGTSASEQDDALAWLESLAQKQGANPDGLITAADARSETAPSWVTAAEPQAEPTAAATEKHALSAPVTGPGTSASEQDDALAWLESLAQKQGANPDELITAADARSRTAPSWVTAVEPKTEPAAAATEKPAISALVTGPGTSDSEQDDALAWLESLAQKAGASPSQPVPSPSKDVAGKADQGTTASAGTSSGDADGLPDWLKSLG